MTTKQGGLRGSIRNVGVGVDAIPQSGLLHDYEASNFDGSTWTDQEGSVDLTANGGPTLDNTGINGEPAVLFDSVDDYFNGTGVDQATPIVVFAVVDFNDDNTITPLYDDPVDQDPTMLYRYDNTENNYRLVSGGNAISGGTATTSPEIITTVIDGGSSSIRQNNTEVVTGTLESETLEDILMGRQDGTERYADGFIGRFLIYDLSQMNSGQISDVEDALNSIYEVY